MATFVDLRGFLEEWPFDANNNARIRRCADGREIILLRTPMGLEQYETDGRRMHGMESLLDFHHARISAATPAIETHGFDLSAEDCAGLFHEGILYHHRLIVLFRLQDWARTARDAAHHLRLIEFVKRHAHCAEDRVQLDQWQPTFARIDAVARALILLEKWQYRDALQVAHEVIGLAGAAADDTPDHAQLAEALRASVRDALAQRPALRIHEESLFSHQDDYWTIRYHGHTAFLKTMRGRHRPRNFAPCWRSVHPRRNARCRTAPRPPGEKGM